MGLPVRHQRRPGLDPLDAAVVEAYWLGNDLLGKVDPHALLDGLRCRFRSQTGGLLSRVAPSPDVLANHGFHVFAVYPWASMLGGQQRRTALGAGGMPDPLGHRGVGRRRAARSVPAPGVGRLPAPAGGAAPETVRWSAEGLSLAATPVPGGVVSMHWDWICERLTPDRTDALADSTAHALDMANAAL